MVDTIHDALGAVLTRWTMGAPAAAGTSLWQEQLWPAGVGVDPGEAELRLLALSGQFLGTMVIAAPAGALRTLPDIPALALPAVPDRWRPLCLRIVARDRDAGRRALLLEFLAARGWTMHPADWMPAAADDDVPDLYAPWRDWALAAAEGGGDHAGTDVDVPTLENWADYWPAARAVALRTMRRRDPAAARALLETKLAGENAETRLRLVDCLAIGLSDDDRSFLEALAAGDRAPKVKALATTLLARLGHGSGGGEDAAELAGFFERQTKGLLKRRTVLVARSTKTQAQAQRRRMLLSSVDATDLAAALGTDFNALIAMWTWGEDHHVDWGLAGMAARSAPDDAVAQLLDRLSGRGAGDMQTLQLLVPRLHDGQRAHAARQVLDAGGTFQSAMTIGGGACRIDHAIDLPAGRALLKSLRDPGEAAKPGAQAEEIHALGMIASRDGAHDAIARLNAAGLLSGDPRLDMMRLNAALDDHGVSE